MQTQLKMDLWKKLNLETGDGTEGSSSRAVFTLSCAAQYTDHKDTRYRLNETNDEKAQGRGRSFKKFRPRKSPSNGLLASCLFLGGHSHLTSAVGHGGSQKATNNTYE